MKDRVFLMVAVLAAGWLAMPEPAAAQQINPNEMSGMLLMADGKRMRGFVQNSNEKGILFALVEGAPGQGYTWEMVKAVALDDANDLMRDPRAAFAAGDYGLAADGFGKIADSFVKFAYIPESFACESRYYQIESLRLLGRFEEIAPLLATPTGNQVFKQLPEYYHSQYKLNIIWGRFGAGDLAGVKAAVDTYVQPLGEQAKLLPGPTFKPMPSHELVQLTYLRAKTYEAAGDKRLALQDLYRTFTLTQANNTLLAKRAMTEAMAIQAEDPKLATAKQKSLLHQMQSLAYFFKTGLNGGEIDPAFAGFAVKPEMPKLPAAEPAKKEEPMAEGPAAGAGKENPPAPAAAKPDDKKKAEAEKPAEKKAEPKKEEEKKAEPKKAEEKKPDEKKPDEKKPDEKKN